MSKKRKDNSGKILRKGESQRKDLIYQYRYTNIKGERKIIYSSNLQDLREKEQEIFRCNFQGIDYSSQNISVLKLVDHYIKLKKDMAPATQDMYRYVLRLWEKEEFGYQRIGNVKTSDAKLFLLKLYEEGRCYGTLERIKGVLNPAFRLAYEDDVILKNPFDFKISDFIVGSTKKKKVLSKQEQKWWLEFLKKDLYYSRYYDDYVILLGTGMRVSEFCGLTKKNLDFENRTICVDHQILYKKDGSKMTYIATPKTQSGIRYIPMTDAVYKSLKNILKRRIERKTEYMIDGYSGFIIQTQTGKPKNRANIEQMTSRALIRYNKLNPDRQIEYITPHTFRHTFCTNLMEKGIDIKSLQYLMGHSEASTTLDVYSHINYEHMFKQMKKVMNSDENVMSTTP